MTAARVAPAQALASVNPDFWASLSDAERLVVPYMFDLWMRPEQRIPRGAWRYYGFICGRGFGKTLGVAVEINRRVEAGEARVIALMAPNEDRSDEVQIELLVSLSPPWFKAERYDGGVRWPNGARAYVFTPLAPGRPRSGNFDLAWLCEIVDWSPNTRREAFNNITTATRVGAAQVIWDTTSKGSNEIIQHLLELHAEDPATYPIQRGSIFDNPILSRTYLRAECRKYTGVRALEELWGMVRSGSAGALWRSEWINDNRRLAPPERPPLTLVSVDPGLSAASTADACGIIIGSRGQDRHSYIEADRSGRYGPEEWGPLVVGECITRRAGVVIERNHLGDNATFVIKAAAKTHGIVVEVLERGKPFPAHVPGKIFVREVVSRESKLSRADGAAAETEAGRVHCVGTFEALEDQWTTYDGSGKSPNEYDASVRLIEELAELTEKEVKTNQAAAMAEARAVHDALKRADIDARSRDTPELAHLLRRRGRGRGRGGGLLGF